MFLTKCCKRMKDCYYLVITRRQHQMKTEPARSCFVLLGKTIIISVAYTGTYFLNTGCFHPPNIFLSWLQVEKRFNSFYAFLGYDPLLYAIYHILSNVEWWKKIIYTSSSIMFGTMTMTMKFGCILYHINMLLWYWVNLNMILCHTLTKLKFWSAILLKCQLNSFVWVCYYEARMQCSLLNNGFWWAIQPEIRNVTH